MIAMFNILYTVDVLPSAKTWRPMAMVYPVNASIPEVRENGELS